MYIHAYTGLADVLYTPALLGSWYVYNQGEISGHGFYKREIKGSQEKGHGGVKFLHAFLKIFRVFVGQRLRIKTPPPLGH